jgi:O-antigen/teichoic acid export membrane protein
MRSQLTCVLAAHVLRVPCRDVTSTGEAPAGAGTGQPDPAALARGFFSRDLFYLGFWAGQIALAAALTPIITRVLGQPEFGLVAACMAVMQLTTAVCSFSLGTAVQRAYAEEHGDADARRLVTFAIVMSILAGIVAYATGRWWCPALGLGRFPDAVRYAVLWAIVTAITDAALCLVRSRDRLSTFAASSFAQSFGAQTLALGLVVIVRRTAAEYMLGQLLGEILAAGIAIVGARPKLISRADRPMLLASLAFSIALVPAQIATFVADASDRLVVNADLGARVLSHYAVARNIGGFSSLLLSLLQFVWLPRVFAIKDPATRRRVLAANRDGLYVLLVSFTLATAAASPAILWLLAPPSYKPRTLLLVTALVMAAAIPLVDAMMSLQELMVRGRTKTVAAIDIGLAVLNLGLNLLVVPTLGIDGSAGITLLCSLLYALVARHQLGADALPTNRRGVGLSVMGIALCVASAAIPPFGIMLVVRLVLTAAVSLVFVGQLLRLANSRWEPYLTSVVVRLQSLIASGRQS